MLAVRSEPALATDRMLTASQKYGVLYQEDFVQLEGRRVVEVILGVDSLKHVEPDDFIISMRSFQGGLEWSQLRGSTSFHYVMLRPIKHVWPPYFSHLFKSTQYIQALRRTTDLIRDGQELRYGNFVQVDLPVVPLEEQRAIAIFLDREISKIDALISEQEKLITLLAEKRQATISHAVTKGLNTNVPMKDSGVKSLGLVPEHWEVKKLKNLLMSPLMYGANEAADDDSRDNPRFVRITDIDSDGSLRKDTFRSLPEDVASQYLLIDGDILLARSGGTVGKAFIYRNSWGRCCFAGYLIKARPDLKSCHPDYIYSCTQTDFYWQYVLSSQTQSTIQNVNAEKYGNLILPLPSVEEQGEIVNFIEKENKKIDVLVLKASRANDLLKERRSALISAAVSGKIDVRQAGRQEQATIQKAA